MQITELAARLRTLGLSDKEARVYVAALFLGPSSVQKIAEQAEVNRPTAYVILDQLASYGLVSESSEGKKTVFVAEGPEALERWLARQEEVLTERKKDLQELAPLLVQSERTETSGAPVVRFYRGQEGVSSVMAYNRRKAKAGSTIYGFTNLDEVDRIFDTPSPATEGRMRKKLSSKVIYSSQTGLTLDSDPAKLREAKTTSSPIQADVSLYEDSASICTYKGKDSVGILIESPEVVGALRQLFEQAWGRL